LGKICRTEPYFSFKDNIKKDKPSLVVMIDRSASMGLDRDMLVFYSLIRKEYA
jgi:hypothetical protein